MIVKILKLLLITFGVLIIQGCSNKEPIYIDRPVEVYITQGCEIPDIYNCNISNEISYNEIVTQMDRCINELVYVINLCKVQSPP